MTPTGVSQSPSDGEHNQSSFPQGKRHLQRRQTGTHNKMDMDCFESACNKGSEVTLISSLIVCSCPTFCSLQVKIYLIFTMKYKTQFYIYSIKKKIIYFFLSLIQPFLNGAYSPL